jgi:hypothetical protein
MGEGHGRREDQWMKKAILIAIAFVMALSITRPTILLAENDSAKNSKVFNELTGMWLNKKYVTSLYKTRSPATSARGILTVALNMTRNDSIYECMEVYNFAEGGHTKTISALHSIDANTYLLTVQADYLEGKTPPHYLVFNTKMNMLEIHYEENRQKFEFVKIGDSLDNYLNKVVLAGKYKNDQNNTYIFGAGGEGFWSGKKFRYQINYMPTVSDVDYFLIKNNDDVYTGEQYVFEWKGNQLFIYNAGSIEGCDGDFIEKDKKPLLCLTKVE